MEILKRAYKGFISRIPSILLLNVLMILLLLILFGVMGTASFSPYVKRLAGQILSVKEVFIFLVLFSIAGFTLEYFLRKHIQERFLLLDKKWNKIAAIAVPSLICFLLHLSFGFIGAVYGILCGLLLSVFYLWKKDWLTLSLWGMLWGFIIVPFSMATCVFVDGQVRNDFLFAYKKRHILKEKMYYQENWGWVDNIHYRPDHFSHLMKAINSADGSGEIELGDSWVTPLRISVRFSAKYKFTVPATEKEKWAMVTGMMLHFMRLNETVQEKSPWYHGNQLSAWQFDDMSSCLLCCLDRYPEEKLVEGKEIKSTDELLKIWEKTGEEIVGFKMKEDESWNLLEKAKRKQIRSLVEAQKVSWSVTQTFNSNE